MTQKNKIAIELDAETKKGTAKVKKFGSDVSDAFDKIKNNAKHANLSLAHMRNRMLGITAAMAGLTIAIKAIAAPLIEYASDLEETQGKFDVVFRGMKETAEGWSSTLQKSYAMAEVEAKKYLSSIQDLIVPTGLARKESGILSNAFVKLAADLGSFNNRETKDVIIDIQSALQGSSETMAKYGINVKAAKVQQEVLNMGLAQNKNEITDAHKALAIYSISMREGSDAVGDMARTQDGYANQQKKFNAKLLDFKTDIGEELLPVITDYITQMNNWYDANDELIKQKIPEYITTIKDGVTSLYEFVTKSNALELGVIGYFLFGKWGVAGALVIAKVVTDLNTLEKAMDAVSKGAISMKEVTAMTAGERETWVKFYESSTKRHSILYPKDAVKKDVKNLSDVKDGVDAVINTVKNGTQANEDFAKSFKNIHDAVKGSTGATSSIVGYQSGVNLRDLSGQGGATSSIADHEKALEFANFLGDSTSDALREGIINGTDAAMGVVKNIIAQTISKSISDSVSNSVSNSVSESVSQSTSSSIGATAGTVIGTAVGGVVGAVAGAAIGGVFDSVFGGGGTPRWKKHMKAFEEEAKRHAEALQYVLGAHKSFREKLIAQARTPIQNEMAAVAGEWNEMTNVFLNEVFSDLNSQTKKIFGKKYNPHEGLMDTLQSEDITSFAKLQAVIKSGALGAGQLTMALELADSGADAFFATLKKFQDIRKDLIEQKLSGFYDDIEYQLSGSNRKDWVLDRIEDYKEVYKTVGSLTEDQFSEAVGYVAEWADIAMQAEKDAAERWIRVADKVKSLTSSIQDTMMGIKYSNLNVSLGSEKTDLAANDYNILHAAAQTGESGAMGKFLSFTSQYLQMAQDTYKSSETYRDIYDIVMGDLEALKDFVQTEDYSQLLYDVEQDALIESRLTNEQLLNVRDELDVHFGDLERIIGIHSGAPATHPPNPFAGGDNTPADIARSATIVRGASQGQQNITIIVGQEVLDAQISKGYENIVVKARRRGRTARRVQS